MATADWKTMDFDQLYPGRFVKAGDFGGRPITVAIARVDMEELESLDKGKQFKALVTFVGTKKQLVLNKTNGLCVRAMFGRKVGAWEGKRVTLYPATEGGELCIRGQGSPDIAEDITFSLELPRKKPRTVTLTKTPEKARAATATAAVPARATPETTSGATSGAISASPGAMDAPPPDWQEVRE